MATDMGLSLASIMHPGGARVHCNSCSSDWISLYSHVPGPSWYSNFTIIAFVTTTATLNVCIVLRTTRCFPTGGKCCAGKAGMLSYSSSLQFRYLS